MNNTTNSSIGCAYVPRKHGQWWNDLSAKQVMDILRAYTKSGIRFVANHKHSATYPN